MVHDNKILTVSYGTFSCTLEGFDDSFDTMKAIAEYFRDLASDDRYFGAEPPVPDAEMLTRIAQRDISRRVEARQEPDGGFVLSAGGQSPTPKALTSDGSTKPDGVSAAPEQTGAEPARKEAPQASETAPRPMQFGAASAVTPFEDTETDDECESVLPDQNMGSGLLDAVTGATEADIPIFEAELVEPAARDVDSIAAKLQRIRAVVSREDGQTGTPANDEMQRDETFLDAVAQDLTDALDADAAAQGVTASEPVEDDQVTEALAQFDMAPETGQEEDAADMPTEQDMARITEAEETPESEQTEPQAKTQPIETDAADPVVSEDAETEGAQTENIADDPIGSEDIAVDTAPYLLTEQVTDDLTEGETNTADDPDATDLDTGQDDAASETNEPGDEAEAGPDVGNSTPRVLKVKRADFEAAVATGAFEDLDGADHAENVDSEDTDALQRALEQLADDITAIGAPHGSEDIDTVAQDVASKDIAAEPDAEDAPDSIDAASDPGVVDKEEDVSRLMAAIDEKMEAPETTDAHETYDKLRGAASAGAADKSEPTEAKEDAYREDLAEIVRPRRPVASMKSADRPTAELRPAPLRLVPEQRVDADAACARQGPVRPRRIASDEQESQDTPSEGASFAEFASEMHAEALPELLEAAASYLVFIEGRAQFSRPQLMNKVRQIDAVAFNREDSLRSFGRLLRDGKIEKTGGGRFTASGEIGFRPDDRVAG